MNKKEYTDYTFEELIKFFFEKCCEQVDYNKSNDKPTEFNATALKTLNCGFRLFCDILGEHLTVDKLKINISTCSNQKAEIVIPEKTLQKALNEVQKAIVETKKASTSTSL